MAEQLGIFKSKCSRFFVNEESKGKNTDQKHLRLHRLVYASGWREKYKLTYAEYNALKTGLDCMELIKNKTNLLNKNHSNE